MEEVKEDVAMLSKSLNDEIKSDNDHTYCAVSDQSCHTFSWAPDHSYCKLAAEPDPQSAGFGTSTHEAVTEIDASKNGDGCTTGNDMPSQQDTGYSYFIFEKNGQIFATKWPSDKNAVHTPMFLEQSTTGTEPDQQVTNGGTSIHDDQLIVIKPEIDGHAPTCSEESALNNDLCQQIKGGCTSSQDEQSIGIEPETGAHTSKESTAVIIDDEQNTCAGTINCGTNYRAMVHSEGVDTSSNEKIVINKENGCVASTIPEESTTGSNKTFQPYNDSLYLVYEYNGKRCVTKLHTNDLIPDKPTVGNGDKHSQQVTSGVTSSDETNDQLLRIKHENDAKAPKFAESTSNNIDEPLQTNTDADASNPETDEQLIVIDHDVSVNTLTSAEESATNNFDETSMQISAACAHNCTTSYRALEHTKVEENIDEPFMNQQITSDVDSAHETDEKLIGMDPEIDEDISTSVEDLASVNVDEPSSQNTGTGDHKRYRAMEDVKDVIMLESLNHEINSDNDHNYCHDCTVSDQSCHTFDSRAPDHSYCKLAAGTDQQSAGFGTPTHEAVTEIDASKNGDGCTTGKDMPSQQDKGYSYFIFEKNGQIFAIKWPSDLNAVHPPMFSEQSTTGTEPDQQVTNGGTSIHDDQLIVIKPEIDGHPPTCSEESAPNNDLCQQIQGGCTFHSRVPDRSYCTLAAEPDQQSAVCGTSSHEAIVKNSETDGHASTNSVESNAINDEPCHQDRGYKYIYFEEKGQAIVIQCPIDAPTPTFSEGSDTDSDGEPFQHSLVRRTANHDADGIGDAPNLSESSEIDIDYEPFQQSSIRRLTNHEAAGQSTVITPGIGDDTPTLSKQFTTDNHEPGTCGKTSNLEKDDKLIVIKPEFDDHTGMCVEEPTYAKPLQCSSHRPTNHETNDQANEINHESDVSAEITTDSYVQDLESCMIMIKPELVGEPCIPDFDKLLETEKEKLRHIICPFCQSQFIKADQEFINHLSIHLPRPTKDGLPKPRVRGRPREPGRRKKHSKTRHRLYKCPTCKKRIANFGNFTRHLRTH